MVALAGAPSDETPGILAVGGSSVGLVFVSLSARHPEGRDAEYLEWHTLDHRPEQQRIPTLVASLRLVSTPECRAARAASLDRYDRVDHVMSYFFGGPESLKGFEDLSSALYAAGRNPGPLPAVERHAYSVAGRVAAPRIKISADVLPWWPVRGMYLLVEENAGSPAELVAVPGVGGAWWASVDGQQITYLYLDADPVEAAGRLSEPLEKRWAAGGVAPLLAAPFHTVAPYDWTRHLP